MSLFIVPEEARLRMPDELVDGRVVGHLPQPLRLRCFFSTSSLGLTPKGLSVPRYIVVNAIFLESALLIRLIFALIGATAFI